MWSDQTESLLQEYGCNRARDGLIMGFTDYFSKYLYSWFIIISNQNWIGVSDRDGTGEDHREGLRRGGKTPVSEVISPPGKRKCCPSLQQDPFPPLV